MSSTHRILQAIAVSGTVKNNGNIISCSESYEYAFCTPESLKILEPLVFTFSIDGCNYIDIDKHAIMPHESVCQFDFGLDRITLNSTITNDELVYLKLDTTLNPVNSTSTPSSRGFAEAAWSPLGIGSFGTCALASLALDHRLTIYVKGYRNWTAVVEPSSVFYEYIKANDYQMPWITRKSTGDFSTVQMKDFYRKAYATAAVKIIWSHMFGLENPSDAYEDQESFALLITGMKNGCIVLWKVDCPIKTSEDLMLATVFDSNLGNISALHWIKLDKTSGYLVIGGKMGQICIYSVNAEMTETRNITASFLTCLWLHEDNNDISHISSIKLTDDSWHIVAAKKNFILAWELSGKNIIDQTHATGNFGQSITGLFADKNSFICSSGVGTIHRISIRKDISGLNISLNEILRNIQNKNQSYVGLCCSPSKAIFVVVQNIKCFYDHLEIREPLKLLFIKNKNTEEVVSDLVTLTEASVPFNYFNDILHYICYSWLEQKQLSEAFTPLLDLKEIQSGTKTLSKLQLARWLLRLATSEELMDEKSLCHESQMDVIESVLTRNGLMQLLNKIERDDYLTGLAPGDHWFKTVLLICQWMKDNYGPQNEPEDILIDKIYRRATSALGTLRFTVFQESCRLCQQPIPLENILVEKCLSGHVFGRCCLSLMICDTPTCKKCTNCDVLASVDACDYMKNARCPFCNRTF